MNTQTYKPITKEQIKKIHVLLQQKGLIEDKTTLIGAYSDGRTESTKELTLQEAQNLISFLLAENAEVTIRCTKVFRAIYNLAWEMGIIYGETEDDYQMNRAKLNMFCRQRGTVKKNISEMNLPEMQKTKRQFEAMYRKFKQKQ